MLSFASKSSRISWFLAVFLLNFESSGVAQTLDIIGGIHTYVALTNTTVNLSGQCELHLTATNNKMTTVTAAQAMPGCVINLNSPDAWLFLDGTRPYNVDLSQIRVNGALAVIQSNVRLVEYGMGSVVIPHSPDYLPLQAFSGSQFSGLSVQASIYTYYSTNSAYGSGGSALLNGSIGSFILKRGYAATFAQDSNGRGISRAYVAADGDLEVGMLPAGLSGAVQFMRVYPWVWNSKKGWAGAVSADSQLVDPLWNYNWNKNAQSTPSQLYQPMQWGSGYSGSDLNFKRGSTLVLGYNEPDGANQANMTVEQATNHWPNMQQSGLRLGSPAPTDGGRSWLYGFMNEVDTMGLRVDVAAIHNYQCGLSSNALRNWLLDVHNKTGRRVYLTEWNNGANWTSCADPTWAQNATVIHNAITMMDNEPWVEAYSIYQWVETNRLMVSDGVLTPAGTNYLNKWSPIAYQQELSGNPKWFLPVNGGVGATNATYQFNGDGLDSSGNGNNALLSGPNTFVNQTLQFDGRYNYAALPPNVGKGADFTFAAWVYWNGGASGQRIFDLGFDNIQYFFLTPATGNPGNKMRFAITTNGMAGEQRLETTALTAGSWTHVAVTINGNTGKLFVNGVVADNKNTITIDPEAIPLIYSYLGKSQFPADPLFKGMMDQVTINGYALSDGAIAALAATGQPPAMPLAPPATPTVLSATPVSVGQIDLAWSDAGGATSYNVKRSTVSGGPYATVARGVTGTSYSDTRCSAGVTYYYAVSGVNLNGESGNSMQASATTTGGVPGVPTLSRSIPNTIQPEVDLVWSVPVGGANSYNLKRATTSGGPYSIIAMGLTGTSYYDTNVLNNTTYYYVVSGVNGYGEGPDSVQVSGTPITPVSLGKPVTASTTQGGNIPQNGNDGSLGNRWTASSGAYPQWWRVDLGSNQPISKAVINWYSSDTRFYEYRIEISDDDANYTTLVDKTGNAALGDTTDIFTASARYVRLYVTGCSVAGFAAFYECSIYAPAAVPQVPSGPVVLTNNFSGGVLSFSWPASQGWRLQTQITNQAVGLGSNWVYVTDGSVSSTNILISQTNGAVFYRLVYP